MEDIRKLESNVVVSFSGVRKDISNINVYLRSQQDVIKQLFDNQKQLLVRIRDLEKKAAVMKVQPVERVMEKKIILTANKIVHKQFLASEASMKLHDPICPFAKNIKPKNKMVFNSKAKAFNNGFKACDCLKRV